MVATPPDPLTEAPRFDVVSRTITVEWSVDGYHRWPEASGERVYLADRHRHRFAFTVTIVVEHADREVEFHDLLDVCRGMGLFADSGAGVDFGRRSCEQLAEEVARAVLTMFPVGWCLVTCSEDGYVTASVEVMQR
jgi:hypothetical protein